MLSVYRSNKLEVLVDQLATQLEPRDGAPSPFPSDPFAPLRIVVGSKGMERWLRHQLASKLKGKICTNTVFPFPTQVMGQALAKLEGSQVDDEPPPDAWSPEALTWALLEVLPTLLEAPNPELAPLRRYLIPSDKEEKTFSGPIKPRALALTGQLADIFDRIVVFRPELALDWSEEGSRLPAEASNLGWLPLLWQAVQEHLRQTSPQWAHQAGRWRPFLRGEKKIAWPFDQPLRIFGIASLPPSFLQQLACLAQAGPVELYLVCPSDKYWANLQKLGTSRISSLLDEDRERLGERLLAHGSSDLPPLLRSMGRVARDMQLVIEGLDQRVQDGTGLGAFADLAPQLDGADNGSTRALHVLQSDVLNLRDATSFDEADRAARPLEEGDDSLQVHACYGATRQVEVLREALLHLFEAHPDLEPRDVLVMVPDIEEYVPIIGAVFEQGPERPAREDGRWIEDLEKRWGTAGAPRIPYAVTERSIRRTNPVAEVLLRVLALAGGQERVSAVTVLDLLTMEPFRRRFGLEHSDLETLSRWVQESGIRWGIDPQDRKRCGQPKLSQNTWRFGIERLALGVCMADAPGRIWEPSPGSPDPEHALGVVPHDAMESGIVHLLGRFLDACTTLFDEIARLRGTHDLSSWLRLIAGDPTRPEESVAGLGTLGRLTATSAKAGWLTARVRTEIEALREAGALAGSQRTLSIQTLHALLSSRFEVASGATAAHTGAVTFAAMAPYRSVPYRVICLLGMDEGSFPRAGGRRRFDPTQLAPRVGDRDPRDEDRYLMLEALMAARDHLLILYTGRDVHSNERCAPAVPVSELLDVVDATFFVDQGKPRSRITREHPLQAFSLDCFDKRRGKPWSYDQALLDSAMKAKARKAGKQACFFPVDEAPPAEPETRERPLREIGLSDLEWFFRNPSKTLLTRGLNLYLPDDQDPVPHREPIEPNGLDRWSWITTLLDHRMAALLAAWDPESPPTAPVADPLERLRAEGALPFGTAGEQWSEAPVALVDQLMARAKAWFDDERAPTHPELCTVDLRLCVEQPHGEQNVRLTGVTDPIWKGDQLCIGTGDLYGQGKHRLGPWLRHLAWVASGQPVEPRTVVLSGRLKQNGEPEVQGISMQLKFADGEDAAERAKAILEALIAIYLEGIERPVPVFPRASLGFAEKTFEKGKMVVSPKHLDLRIDSINAEIVKALGSARQAAITNFYGDGRRQSRFDLECAYTARIWTDFDPIGVGLAGAPPLQHTFASHALTLWQPLLGGWTREWSKPTIAPRPPADGGAS